MALIKEEENIIADVTDYYIHIRCPLTKVDMLDMVQDFVEMLPLNSKQSLPFKNYRPSNGWLRGFLKRYPKINLKRPNDRTSARIDALHLSRGRELRKIWSE